MQEGIGHHGSKASKLVFIGRQNRLFTTGFSKHSERQYALWDAVSVFVLNSMSMLARFYLLATTAALQHHHFDTCDRAV